MTFSNSIGLVIAILMFSPVCKGDELEQIWKEIESINTVRKMGVAASLAQAKQLDGSTAIPGVFELWSHKEKEIVELTWWKHENRVTRTFVLALFYTQESRKTRMDFGWEIKRFEKEEREHRQEELAFVMKNIEKLRETIDALFEERQEAKRKVKDR